MAKNLPLFQGIKIPDGLGLRIVRDITYLINNHYDIYITVMEILVPDYADYLAWLAAKPRQRVSDKIPDPPAISYGLNMIRPDPKSLNRILIVPQAPDQTHSEI